MVDRWRMTAGDRCARLTVPAPAKVNLFLHVTGRRADGYHTLESLFALIDLADTLDARAARRRRDPPRRSDVAGVARGRRSRGARGARAAAGERHAAAAWTIALDKRIPLGGGLGGGSSDAASVLLALNRLWELGLSRAALPRSALHARRRRAVLHRRRPRDRARHRRGARAGHRCRRTWLVLADTRRARARPHAIFAAPELTRDDAVGENGRLFRVYGRNDLEPVAAARFPDIASALADAAARSRRRRGCPVRAPQCSPRSRASATPALPLRCVPSRSARARSCERSRGIRSRRSPERGTGPGGPAARERCRRVRFPLGSRQVVRHRILIPAFVGSIPPPQPFPHGRRRPPRSARVRCTAGRFVRRATSRVTE